MRYVKLRCSKYERAGMTRVPGRKIYRTLVAKEDYWIELPTPAGKGTKTVRCPLCGTEVTYTFIKHGRWHPERRNWLYVGIIVLAISLLSGGGLLSGFSGLSRGWTIMLAIVASWLLALSLIVLCIALFSDISHVLPAKIEDTPLCKWWAEHSILEETALPPYEHFDRLLEKLPKDLRSK